MPAARTPFSDPPRRRCRPNGDVPMVETLRFRDGKPSAYWRPLGIDTARTLGIAEVMTVSFRAIDFTTRTHMGVAVRYKEGRPVGADSLNGGRPNGRIHRANFECRTRFSRFISPPPWETASLRIFLGRSAFRKLARNGHPALLPCRPYETMRTEHCLCSRHGEKKAAAEYAIVALVFSISPPFHDDAHYIERRGKLASCRPSMPPYSKDPRPLPLKPSRGANAQFPPSRR